MKLSNWSKTLIFCNTVNGFANTIGSSGAGSSRFHLSCRQRMIGKGAQSGWKDLFFLSIFNYCCRFEVFLSWYPFWCQRVLGRCRLFDCRLFWGALDLRRDRENSRSVKLIFWSVDWWFERQWSWIPFYSFQEFLFERNCWDQS